MKLRKHAVSSSQEIFQGGMTPAIRQLSDMHRQVLDAKYHVDKEKLREKVVEVHNARIL